MEKTYYLNIFYKGEKEDMHDCLYFKDRKNVIAKFNEEKQSWIKGHLDKCPFEESEEFDSTDESGSFYSDMSEVVNDILDLNFGVLKYEDE